MTHPDQGNVKEESSKEKLAERPSPCILPEEKGGTKGPEPTRYGDWERNGRCIDF